ncbi:hypothetical protein HYT02_00855 [Candidatus Gottesmanbacteria bacterium]|nr:hypothetical protein [Candidatus Gottesmanbacteria bacterium]
MNQERRLPVIPIIIIIVLIIIAVSFFLLRKQSLVSPVPEGGNVKVIFTSPPATEIPTQTPTPQPSPTPTA